MTQSSKVVSIDPPDGVAAVRRKSVPPVLHTIRQHAKRELNDLVQNMFNNADDALFEMADRSTSDADQHMFFESMRAIRLERKSISKRFISVFYRSFEELFDPPAESSPATESAPDLDTPLDGISLVHNDELEVSVAMAGIVSKVTSHYSLPIMQVTKRVDSLCDVNTVNEKLNPLGPHQVTSAFIRAIADLDVDIKVRIIILKLFERYVMGSLDGLYAEANRLLIDAGVLPDLKNVMRRSRSTDVSSGRERRAAMTAPGQHGGAGFGGGSGAGGVGGNAGAGSATGPGGADDFGVLQGLLAQARHSGEVAAAQAIGGPVISTPELMQVLSGIQSDAVSAPLQLDQAPAPIDLRQLVLTRSGSAQNMAQADDDVVNLVSMLFDYILNDRNLAIPMKALIARLQIPILKVAVLDKTFFAKTSHPARQLLNELSSAGIGWSSSAELKRDNLYNLIESTVLQVLNNFEDDLELLRKLTTELREYVGRDRKKNDRVEQRVKESEEGRAITRAVKSSVQNLINQKACGLRLPPEIGRFVSEQWSKVMTYVGVKFGIDDAEWHAMVQTFDDLLWAVQPLSSLENIERREQTTTDLNNQLRRGLEFIKLRDEEISRQLLEINAILAQISETDRAYLGDDALAEVHDDFEAMEEIILTEPERSEEIQVPAEPEFLQQVERLSPGTWVELHDNDTTTRCKLATIVQPGDRYVFVNRRGLKVAERSKMGLATELKRKTMTVLDESQVFDRALQAVIGNLRHMHRDPAAQ